MNTVRIALNIGSVVLVGILGWLIVRIIMGVMNPQSLYAPEPIVTPSSAVTSSSGAAHSYDFSSDPFNFGDVPIIDDEPIEDAPETTLNLKLKGIVSDSSAVFRLADGKDKTVEIDEEVMDGVTLTSTAKDFVMLDVNGDLQRLTLERVKLEAESGKSTIIRAAPAASVGPSRADAERLFSQIQLTPDYDMGPNRKKQIQGFKIKARPGTNLDKFGLKSGDVVTRIGPVLLNKNSPNIKELRGLMSTGAAQDIEVLRDGKVVTIRLGQ